MNYLIELTIGPVQGFIAAARRSRDLWAGSSLLSEVVRALALSLRQHPSKAELIYPLLERVEGKTDSNLSNIVLAEVKNTDLDGVRTIVAAAKAAAQQRLSALADQEKAKWLKAGVALREELWERQIEQALEIYAAWSVVKSDYKAAYGKVKAALAARKNTRDFPPSFDPPSASVDPPGTGIPKSSLDGAAESVLPQGGKQLPAQFGVGPGEQLDAMGCIKRSYGRQEKFTALSRLAADAWLCSLDVSSRQELVKYYAPLVEMQLATRALGNDGKYNDFPFDASLLYDEPRAQARDGATGEERKALDALDACIRDIAQAKDEHGKRRGKPNPYVALMVADGDRMGKFVDAAKDADAHRAISGAISTFADGVAGIARNHRGHVMYAGGEDLMIAFPRQGVDKAARELAQRFDACIKEVADRLEVEQEKRPTLRVGVAICHLMTPFGDIRQHAADAEREAKRQGGNALALSLHIRSGQAIKIAMKFDSDADFSALQQWQDAYREGKAPGRLAYDLLQVAQRYGHVQVNQRVELLPMGEIEMRGVFKRARERGGHESISEVLVTQLLERLAALRQRLVLQAVEFKAGDPDLALRQLAHELLLARWMSAANASELGERE